MNARFLVMLCLVLGAACARAASFDDANRAFAEKRYAEAARGFEAVIAERGFSAPVLFNLANSYYRDGKLGLAILNYERARLLAPRDADIAANLSAARNKAMPGATSRIRSDFALRGLSLNELSVLGGIGSLMLGAGLVFCRITRKHSFLGKALMVGSVAILIGVGSVFVLRWPELRTAVVTAKEARAFIAPTDVGSPILTLAEGDSVELCKSHNGFVLVETRAGRRGWVSRDQVTPVFPDAQASAPHTMATRGRV